jgi:hypothetical protein
VGLWNLVVVMDGLPMMITSPFGSAVVCRQRRVAAAIAAPGPVRRIQRTQKPVQSAHSKFNA